MTIQKIANTFNNVILRCFRYNEYYLKYCGHQLTEEEIYDYIGILLEDIDEMQKRLDDYRENYELKRGN